jgi:hypothetical protein
VHPSVKFLMLRAERLEGHHRIHPRYYGDHRVAKVIDHTIKIVHLMGSEDDPRASY